MNGIILGIKIFVLSLPLRLDFYHAQPAKKKVLFIVKIHRMRRMSRL